MEPKTPSQSEVTMSELVLPNDTNLLGNLIGGRLMYWMDIAGALVASRHSNRVVATVSIDNITFRHPVRMGEMVIIKAKIIYTGTTSMSVLVKVYAENLKSGNILLPNQAIMVFVALDEAGVPVPVPPLMPQTGEEKKLFEEERQKRLAFKK